MTWSGSGFSFAGLIGLIVCYMVDRLQGYCSQHAGLIGIIVRSLDEAYCLLAWSGLLIAIAWFKLFLHKLTSLSYISNWCCVHCLILINRVYLQYSSPKVCFWTSYVQASWLIVLWILAWERHALATQELHAGTCIL